MTRMKPGAVAAIATVMIGIFVATALPGCGVKSAPIPPEYARPERILSLRAAPAAGGIMLSWDRPTQYPSGHAMRDLELHAGIAFRERRFGECAGRGFGL